MQKVKSSRKESVREGHGKFNFPNGDCYEGGYIVIGNKDIYRHGYGIYRTSVGDEYRAVWEKDLISSNLLIAYDNKAQYDGELDSEGAMEGQATYTFPDGTALKAQWKDNQPISDFVYSDALGFHWLGKLNSTKQEVEFSPENHIWTKYVN